MNINHRPNHDLKEDIRAYWSDRSRTFDLDFGHGIADGREFEAWAKAIRQGLGDRPQRILELACGTGEITRVLASLGHAVTAIDFSEAMLAVSKAKHWDTPNVRFLLADAEFTMEPDATYDAIVCRHLVWTLTQPQQAFADWHRVLKRGGKLLFFDGNWATPTLLGRAVSWLIGAVDRIMGRDVHVDGAMGDRHADIMRRLPFGSGLTPETVVPLLESAGFTDVKVGTHSGITRGQSAGAGACNKLRTLVYRKFVISAIKSR
jgi:ubiquinone/menaquinone biosynthesis C-methylase UbiE